jgi:hypothetical protein
MFKGSFTKITLPTCLLFLNLLMSQLFSIPTEDFFKFNSIVLKLFKNTFNFQTPMSKFYQTPKNPNGFLKFKSLTYPSNLPQFFRSTQRKVLARLYFFEHQYTHTEYNTRSHLPFLREVFVSILADTHMP